MFEFMGKIPSAHFFQFLENKRMDLIVLPGVLRRENGGDAFFSANSAIPFKNGGYSALKELQQQQKGSIPRPTKYFNNLSVLYFSKF